MTPIFMSRGRASMVTTTIRRRWLAFDWAEMMARRSPLWPSASLESAAARSWASSLESRYPSSRRTGKKPPNIDWAACSRIMRPAVSCFSVGSRPTGLLASPEVRVF